MADEFRRRLEDKLEDEERQQPPIPGEEEETRELPLRARPVQVTRFNRKVVGLILAAIAIVTAFSLLYSLSPKKKKTAEEAQEKTAKSTEAVNLPTLPESVTAAPRNYQQAQGKRLPPGVPRLPTGAPAGPATRRVGAAAPGTPAGVVAGAPLGAAPENVPELPQGAEGGPTYVPAPVGAAPPATPGAPGSAVTGEAERREAFVQTKEKRVEEARKSPVEFSSGGKEGEAKGGVPAIPQVPQVPQIPITPQALSKQGQTSDDQNMQDEKRTFLREKRDDIYVKTELVAPISPYEIKAGTIFPATLITGINSDLPGQITAQISENVYDTVAGRYLLVPQGTRIVGEYDSKVTYGQERVLVVWHRLIFPNGWSISLEGMPGVDLSGYSGLKDRVNNHYWKLITGVVLGSVIGAGAQVAVGGQGSPNNPASFGQQAVSGAAQNFNQAGQAITQKNLNVQPTIEIRPGLNVNIFTTKDLILQPYSP